MIITLFFMNYYDLNLLQKSFWDFLNNINQYYFENIINSKIKMKQVYINSKKIVFKNS